MRSRVCFVVVVVALSMSHLGEGVVAVEHADRVPDDGPLLGLGVARDHGREPEEQVPILHVARHLSARARAVAVAHA